MKNQEGDALLFFRWVSQFNGYLEYLLLRLQKGLHSCCSGRSSFDMHCAALPVKTQKGDALLFLRCVSHLYVV